MENPPPPSPPKQSEKRKPPTPEELVAHYESQGLDSREASLRVIRDLQSLFYRTVVSDKKRKERLISDTSRKLDNANTRLAILEMKLDSKPGFFESFAVGVASAASFRGASAAFPHVAGALGNVWEAVKSATARRTE
ncbi:hypothetical protein QJS04_geneDACA013990 [Acorus gramineus]|uniref:Uncharacterized protein n=1 Tax=Acorus gramineus TaxID=55184 RepID=A0AAV9B0L2_ACOGR|nr:hypothetical protein QJS04_geneDACA013990 [Acorus gramineus]